MRHTEILSDGWVRHMPNGELRSVSLPLRLKADEAKEKIELSRRLYVDPEDANTEFYLETRSLSGKVRVYVDNEEARVYRSRYAPRATDLTPLIRRGEEQRLRLVITPEVLSDGCFGFSQARLIGAAASHFEISDLGAPLSVRTVFIKSGAAVTVKAEIANPNNYDVLLFRLCAPSGAVLETRAAKPTDPTAEFFLEDPKRWDGVHAAHKYRAEVILQRDADILDVTELSFGIREAGLDGDGFFTLNGVKTPLLGAAARDSLHPEQDLKALEALDANLLLLDGADPAAALTDACDETGTILFFLYPDVDGEQDLEDIRGLARMLDTHPSAAFLGCRSRDPGFLKKFCAAVRSGAQNLMTAGLSDLPQTPALSDAIPDLLILTPSQTDAAALSRLDAEFDEAVLSHPEFRFAVFPKAPECIYERHSEGALRPDCSQEFFAAWHEQLWQIFSKHGAVSCYLTGYLTDAARDRERTGLLTYDRANAKDAFRYYKSQFTGAPYVKFASLPDFVTRKRVALTCYTNGAAPKLTVNGKTQKHCVVSRRSPGVYRFENVKLRRRDNTFTVTCGEGTDRASLYRSKSSLKKK